MENNNDFIAAIRRRYSCRNYLNKPIEPETRNRLETFINSINPGPFGHRTRFKLVAATEDDRRALRGLGTYGFIRGATGFIIGAIQVPNRDENAPHYLEDFGYAMEKLILQMTALGLGTCWLGGTFTKSSFAQKIDLHNGDLIPCVTAAGYPVGKPHLIEGLLRREQPSDRRRGWENLFFDLDFSNRLQKESAGYYQIPLEMVRLSPSASNRQPWRVVRQGHKYHFYLQRTPGYREGMLVRLVTVADLQRIDMGIAMSHFEVSVRQLGISGQWQIQDPDIPLPQAGGRYIASWVS